MYKSCVLVFYIAIPQSRELVYRLTCQNFMKKPKIGTNRGSIRETPEIAHIAQRFDLGPPKIRFLSYSRPPKMALSGIEPLGGLSGGLFRAVTAARHFAGQANLGLHVKLITLSSRTLSWTQE